MRCHRFGHNTVDCPDKPKGKASSNVPSDPCWSCRVMHWAHGCEIQQQRTANGVCILCGDSTHWLRAYPLFDPAVYVRKNPRFVPPKITKCTTMSSHDIPRSYVASDVGMPNITQPADCASADPPVSFPPDQHDEKWNEVCLWHGIKGHELKDCWRRALAIAAANATAIASLLDERKGINKSAANVDKVQTTVDNLGQQMSTLIKW